MEVGQFLGWTRDSANWAVQNRTAIIQSYVDAGYRKWITAHNWSFLKPTITLQTAAPYATGTVTIVAGVVTLAGGTWPTWAAAGELNIAGITYTITSRDSGTQLTLDDLTVAVAAGATYQLVQPYIDLPADFGGLLGPITFQPGANNLYQPLIVVGEYEIRRRRQPTDRFGRPEYAATRIKTTGSTIGQRTVAGSTGQRSQLCLWPIPDALYPLTFRMRIEINALNTTNVYPVGGPSHSETIKEACLAAAELGLNNTIGVHEATYQRLLAESVTHDSGLMTPEHLGIDRDRSEPETTYYGPRHLASPYLVTYEGHPDL